MSAFSRIVPRVPHAQGATQIVFSQDGSQIVTAGDDYFLRVVSTSAVRDGDEEDEDARTIDHHRSTVTCLDVYENMLVSGSDDQSACLFSLPTCRLDRSLIRCTLTIRHVAIRPGQHKPRWVAVASDELDIKLIDVDDITNMVLLKGHTRSVKSLAFDHKGDFLASAGSDGAVCIWDTRNNEGRLVKMLDGLIVSSEPESNELCRISWHPSGKLFAVPGRNKDVLVVEKATFMTKYTLKDLQQDTEYTVVAWSPNGAYLAAVNLDGHFSVWAPDVNRKEPLISEKHSTRISAFAWHPKENDICFTDIMGRMLYWKDVMSLSDGQVHPATARTSVNPALAKLFDDDSSSKPFESWDNFGGRLETEQPKATDANDSDADEDDDDFVVDDDGAGYAEALEGPGQFRKYHEKGKKRVLKQLSRDFPLPTRGLGIYDADIQDPFQPGATPMKNNRRYLDRVLAFNMTGVIYTIDAHTHSNVNVEFHDRTQRPIRFTDHYNYSMASLGQSGAAFACESSGGNPSAVFYRPFDNWATKADWTLRLNMGENVKALALSSSRLVAATDQRYLRYFSLSGIQLSIERLPGPIVTMAAQGDLLMIVYHAGGVYHGDQRLEYLLQNAETQETIREHKVPLSPGSTLQWVGISESGIPSILDSAGVLQLLLPHSKFKWVTVLDTKVARGQKQESYWPVELTDKQLMCVTCKGTEKYPGFPTPIINEVAFQVPFVQLDTPNGGQEEKLFRTSILSVHMRGEAEAQGTLEEKAKQLLMQDIEMDKMILHLIQGERSQRALDLCAMLHTIRSIDGAIKLAVHHHMPGLAERMTLIKEVRGFEWRRTMKGQYGRLISLNQARQRKEKEEEDEKRERRLQRSISYFDPPPESSFADKFESSTRRSGLGGMVGAAPVSSREASPIRPLSAGVAPRERKRQPVYEQDAPMREYDDVSHDSYAHRDQELQPQPQKRSTSAAGSRVTTPARESENGRSKVLNPFAIPDSEKKKHAPVAGSNLFDAIKQMANPKKDIEETRSKQMAAMEATKKRKNQTTLFGLPKRDEDDAPAEKKPRKSKKSSEDDAGAVSAGPSSAKKPGNSIASFLGIKPSAERAKEDIQENGALDEGHVGGDEVPAREMAGDEGGVDETDASMDVDGPVGAAGSDTTNEAGGNEEEAPPTPKRDKGKTPIRCYELPGSGKDKLAAFKFGKS
ncbi:hypothetical protein HK104_006291 [Borealophlyctis nickersoniae]|nr:hypothetical protein HK104_006291 [Borealophlyctis nickersoniae]